MLHWLHSLLPNVPRYGYVLVFVVVFLNNIGFPLPGETILLGAGFVLGESRRIAVGAHGGWIDSLLLRRQLFFLAGPAVGPWQFRKDSLAPSHARTA